MDRGDLSSTDQRALLAELLADQELVDEAPLVSFAQQRLWFLDRMDPGTPTYNIPIAVRLRGALDHRAFQQAVDGVVRRHESLRTVFSAADGIPRQEIKDNLSPRVVKEDFRNQSARALRDRLSELARAPFDLTTGPLLRFWVLELADDENLVLIVIHHIVSDGWSMGILFREIATLYNEYRSGAGWSLPSLEIQYSDYSEWQRENLSGPQLKEHVEFWRSQLAGAPTLLEIPTDRPRPAIQSYQGAVTEASLPAELVKRLRQIARERDCTLFMILISALAVLFSRYCRTKDVVIGMPIAGRQRAELEPLIGLFVNILPIRIDVAEDMNFSRLLTQVKDTTVRAFEHQDLPFEKLVEELQPERSLNHSPIIQAMLNLHNQPFDTSSMDGLEASEEPVDTGTVKFDFDLHVFEKEDSLYLRLFYSEALFDSETVNQMLSHFENLLQTFALDIESRTASVPLLNEEEYSGLVVDFNDTDTHYPDECIHTLIEQSASKLTDQEAISFKTTSVTYGELDLRANQLAHHLRALGIGSGALVGIHVDRSIDMVISLLGVLKSGAAYVPLDPAYPAERLAYMVSDAGLNALITDQDECPFAPELLQISLSRDKSFIDELSRGQLNAEIDPDALAYIIYTSGSTGKPKGVPIRHSSVVNFLNAMRKRPGLGEDDVLLSVTTLSFDISVLEIFLPLLVGARLTIADRETASNGEALLDEINRSQATVMQATPTTWRMLIESGWRGTPKLTALCGGEALSRNLAENILSRCECLWNLYGPTEATVWASASRVEPGKEIDVGRPIDNTRLYVLDENTLPVPPGIAGELCIGGDCLSPGYLHRPELTKEKFVSDPFDHARNGSLYKTGDLARFDRRGRLQVIGRLDHQVKVRGFRIELGEIESVLEGSSEVTQAVCAVREDTPGDLRLVAYVVAANSSPNVESIRAMLTEQLPAHMVPTAIVEIDSMPLTPNGKVDRNALPVPGFSSVLRQAYVPPESPTESNLAEIFASILRVERIGALDDFFALGGHSLLATQLVSRLRDTLSIDLPLKTFFQNPTVRGLAKVLDEQQGDESGRIPTVDRAPDGIVLSFAQERLWFFDQLEPGNSTYNLAMGIRLRGSLNRQHLQLALDALIQRHESLRTTFVSRKGEGFQRILDDLPVRIVHEQVSEEDLSEKISALVKQPIDLRAGPLLRVSVLQVSPTEQLLLLVIHHIVSDGWSLGVLSRELTELYNGMAAGKPVVLAPLPIQYADFAVWQREWLSGSNLEGQLEYWRDLLEDAPATLDLPTDRPRPAMQTYRGARCHAKIPQDLAIRLNELAATESSGTLFMLLFAAYSVLLARWAGQDDIVVGIPIAGRRRSELESLIGFFINTLPVRLDLGANPTFMDMLRRTKQVTLDAYANQDLPFEKLVEELNPARDTSHTPIFQVMFNLHNEPITVTSPIGLEAAPEPIDGTTSKFDLTLHALPTPVGLELTFEYNRDLFDPATIDRLARQYRRLLESVVAAPSAGIADLPLLSDREQEAHLRAREAAKPDKVHQPWPKNLVTPSSLVTLFEEQAAARGDAIAAVAPGVSWTYKDLNRFANGHAKQLISAGVQPGSRVALFCRHEPAMVAALLGVLKAGCAYVPIDPDWPQPRVSKILSDAEISFALVDESLEASWPASLKTLSVNALSQVPEPNPTVPATNDSLAYVLFTSGTTGKPKGVMQTRRNVMHHVRTYTNALRLDRYDRLSFLASYSVDAAVQDIFGALLNGATLFPIDVRDEGGPTSLLSKISEAKITVLHCAPTVFRYLFSKGEPTVDLSRVRLVVLGGEEVRPSDFDIFRAHFSQNARFINGFGLTESTVALQYFATHDTLMAGGVVPIGHAVSDTQVFITDKEGRKGAFLGEIQIASEFLAEGYLGQSELTSERFVSTDSGTASTRTYKTGDLGRLLPSGEMVFAGRKDQQIKLRGHRIEPAEIEANLESHQEVRSAAVVLRRTSSEEDRLVAFVVPVHDLSNTDLRTFLVDRLPTIMVPARFVELEELPTTPSGKVDYATLQELAVSAVLDSDAPAPPRNPLEFQLLAIWQQVLGVDDIGTADNFFDIGGNSLIAVQLFSQLHSIYGKHFPLATLFQAPTIQTLAEVLSTSGWSPPWRSLVAIQPGDEKLPLFLIPGVGGNVLTFAQVARLLGPDQPVYGLQARGLDGRETPFSSIEDMASDYVSEMRSIQPKGPYQLGGACWGGSVAFEMAKQLIAANEQVSLLTLIDPSWPGPSRKRSLLPHSLRFVYQGVMRHVKNVFPPGLERWDTVSLGEDFYRQGNGSPARRLSRRSKCLVPRRGDRRQ